MMPTRISAVTIRVNPLSAGRSMPLHMGSISKPLPLAVGEMLTNDWDVCGNFMCPKGATAHLTAMVASGVLDLATVNVACFQSPELPAAMDAATRMRALDLTVVTPS